jgi:hypothetical protein
VEQAVPLWAFVALALVAPLLALVGVLISSRAESKRAHRNWLRETKYESYERLFVTHQRLKEAYAAFLDATMVSDHHIENLRRALRDLTDQVERTQLVASLRVGMAMDREIMATVFAVMMHLDMAIVGVPPPKPPGNWGDMFATRQAVRADLGSRRDERWFGAKFDRRTGVPHWTLVGAIQPRWWKFKRWMSPTLRKDDREADALFSRRMERQDPADTKD